MKPLDTHNYYVYILTNKSKRTLYTGITNDLKRRLFEHQNPLPFSRAFTARYRCYYLLYYELFNEVNTAILREKQIKGMSRAKKEALIASQNPKWKFLNNLI